MIYLNKEPIYKRIEFNLQNSNISNINFMVKHDNMIINSINLINETINVLAKNEDIGVLHIIEDYHSETNSTIGTIFNKLHNLNNTISDLIHNIVLYILVLITVAIIVFICAAMFRKNY